MLSPLPSFAAYLMLSLKIILSCSFKVVSGSIDLVPKRMSSCNGFFLGGGGE